MRGTAAVTWPDPGYLRGACFARPWIPAHLSEPRQGVVRDPVEDAVGTHVSQPGLLRGRSRAERRGAAVYTRVTCPSAARRDRRGQHGSFCHNAGDLDPRSWLWRCGSKGPRWAEASWPWRQGVSRSPVSPGKGQALGGPGDRPPGGMGLGGPRLCWLPGDVSASARAELRVSAWGPWCVS